MKLIPAVFIVAVISCLSTSMTAQNSDKEITSMKTANSEREVYEYRYHIDSAKLETKIVHDDPSENFNNIEYYDNFIQALETKKAYVLNHPEEKAIAEEEGWFEKIELEITKAKAARKQLLQK